MKNSASREGGSITAACFLERLSRKASNGPISTSPASPGPTSQPLTKRHRLGRRTADRYGRQSRVKRPFFPGRGTSGSWWRAVVREAPSPAFGGVVPLPVPGRNRLPCPSASRAPAKPPSSTEHGRPWRPNAHSIIKPGHAAQPHRRDHRDAGGSRPSRRRLAPHPHDPRSGGGLYASTASGPSSTIWCRS